MMSDDEGDNDGPAERRDDEPQLDEKGYPVSIGGPTGGKFQAQLNPLQQKLEKAKKEKEEKAAREAKKAALASRAAAFGSIKPEGKAAEEEKPKEVTGKVPEVEKARLDGKVVDMMRSGIVTKTRVIGRGGMAGRGRGRGGRAGGPGTPRTDGTETPDTEENSKLESPEDVESDSSDGEEELAKRKAAAAAKARAFLQGAVAGVAAVKPASAIRPSTILERDATAGGTPSRAMPVDSDDEDIAAKPAKGKEKNGGTQSVPAASPAPAPVKLQAKAAAKASDSDDESAPAPAPAPVPAASSASKKQDKEREAASAQLEKEAHVQTPEAAPAPAKGAEADKPPSSIFSSWFGGGKKKAAEASPAPAPSKAAAPAKAAPAPAPVTAPEPAVSPKLMPVTTPTKVPPVSIFGGKAAVPAPIDPITAVFRAAGLVGAPGDPAALNLRTLQQTLAKLSLVAAEGGASAAAAQIKEAAAACGVHLSSLELYLSPSDLAVLTEAGDGEGKAWEEWPEWKRTAVRKKLKLHVGGLRLHA